MVSATGRSEALDGFVALLAGVIGHADRRGPLFAYLCGLLLPGKRKSVEPIAARLAPTRVSAEHQSLLHFVGKAPWSDDAVLRETRKYVLPLLEGHGPIEAWIIDDSGLPKKGKHSVGVANQYCGVLGKNHNCQVAVSLSFANESGSLPVGHRLYLPESWANDAVRRAKVGVPKAIAFKRKWEIALDLVDEQLAEEDDAPRGVVLADAGYGDVFEFRSGLTQRGLRYAVGVSKNVSVWQPGEGPLPPEEYSGRGRPPKKLRRDDTRHPVTALALARSLPAEAWRTATWREGSDGMMNSRFAALRVRPGHRDFDRTTPHAVEWLLIEWPEGDEEPTKYWLSTEPEDTPLPELVRKAKLRWRIERDYQELKQEVGFGHYEGRSWRGFHHHTTLCIAAYGFLIAERARLSPPDPREVAPVEAPELPQGYRPRGAPNPSRASPADVHPHDRGSAGG